MDNHTAEVRSYNMSQIKSKNTKPELMVRKFLFSKGFRYRKNVNTLPGIPDLVLKKHKTVIFINGCFWHMHDGCRYAVIPKTRTDYWTKKLSENVIRDQKAIYLLEGLGWHVIIIWECELINKKFEQTMCRLTDELNSQM